MGLSRAGQERAVRLSLCSKGPGGSDHAHDILRRHIRLDVVDGGQNKSSSRSKIIDTSPHFVDDVEDDLCLAARFDELNLLLPGLCGDSGHE